MEISLQNIARTIDGEIKGNPAKPIQGVAPFDDATGTDITYAGNASYLKRMDETGAGAVMVPRDFDWPETTLVRVDNPQVAFAKVVALFHPPSLPEAGISPKACIGERFVCGEDAAIAPCVVIQNNVSLGDRVTLHPNVTIGDDVTIGNDVLIYPGVRIRERCTIGNRVTIHANTVIGSDGFGFAPDGGGYYKIPQIGTVRIDDDVEIGACNTIDRATFGTTWIQRGVKTDNLVQIAHNVTVGEDTVLVSQVGISGSVTIGRHAILAGQAGVSGHLTIGDNVTIGPQSGVAKSIPEGKTVSGSPELPHRLWLRVQRIMPRLPELKKKISEIEKRINRIEEKNVGGTYGKTV
jgi:UDP-3-O-[3-hydroxymyristoyl] glucosamine N-acyltransferase